MTGFQRIRSTLIGVLMLISSFILIRFPDYGFMIIAGILSISLAIYGIRTLVFYFTLARHMVGGREIFYLGVIVLDFGIFTITVADVSPVFLIAYLLAVYVFAGLIDILRALEAKKLAAPSWKFRLAGGIVSIIIALVAVVFGIVLKSMDTLVYIYAIGLIYSAVTRIITAFRKSAMVYIQ
ncbi:MAG: DUF308 domain-containing protein [Lachnospiraceae bacterium]|nr:DUF308 domain-containing protein [Lachnospiraceae bacterium]